MTGTYHIWPITIGLIVAYLFSLAGMRLGISGWLPTGVSGMYCCCSTS